MKDMDLENPYIRAYPDITFEEFYGLEGEEPEEPFAVYDPD